MVFSDRIWPNLVSWSSEPSVPDYLYLYDPIAPYEIATGETTSHDIDSSPSYHPVSPMVSVLAMPISHGLCRSSHAHAASGTYTSSAFFIQNTDTHKQFLFFGDVEPDSLALNPSTKGVWRFAAPLITSTLPSGKKVLDSIFIECSWPTTRGDKELYGHLNPQHLLHEMKVLASEIRQFQDSRSPTLPLSSSKSINQILSSTPPSRDGEKTPQVNGIAKKQRRRTIIKRQSRSNTSDCNISDLSTPTSSNIAIPISSVEGTIPSDPNSLKGTLKGVKLYVMHCKAPMEMTQGIERGKLSQYITSEVRTLVEQEELGLEVIAMEQGMRVCKLIYQLNAGDLADERSISNLNASRVYLFTGLRRFYLERSWTLLVAASLTVSLVCVPVKSNYHCNQRSVLCLNARVHPIRQPQTDFGANLIGVFGRRGGLLGRNAGSGDSESIDNTVDS